MLKPCRFTRSVLVAGAFLAAEAAYAAAPALQVLAPHGGEVYFVGQTQQFLFSSKLKTFTLELSRDGGTEYAPLGPVNNTGKDPSTHNVYSFSVTGPASNNCVIRASGTAGKTTVQVVSGGFAIQNSTASDSANTPNTVVLRDGSGDFSAGTITANLAGNVSGSAASFTGMLGGDVTGPQSATAIQALQGTPVLIDVLGLADGEVLTYSASAGQWAAAQPAPTGVGLLFGDGHDGDVILASDTTLANDMYYNSLIVQTGVTLSTNGFRIFVRNACEINGTIDNSGGNGADAISVTGGAGGSGGTEGSLGGGTTGGIGALFSAGNSSGLTDAIGGAGGAGDGGTSGEATAVPAAAGGPAVVYSFVNALSGRDLNGGLLTGGTGGGGGSDNGGTLAGGGGGGGGGVIVLAAQTITGNGQVAAHGGNGGNGAGPIGVPIDGGGGGGGGGGAIIILSTVAPAAGVTLNVSGGLAGTGGAGISPISGGNGLVVVLY